ncbi:MAG: CDP-glucose 4,6-dehydratase [Cyanobacteria bacterium P01_G01_bin.38]
MDSGFWQGKRVLVTGHTGFKGSWLSLWLQLLGAEVIGYALAPHTDPNLFELAQVAEGMTSLLGDIRDLPVLQQMMMQQRPEIVIHMAAEALVRQSYADPVSTYATNVMGTVNVLEAVRHTPSVKAVVSVTSDKCYENREWVWGYREHEAMGGYDPYSSSKGCAELVTAAYRNSFFKDGTDRGCAIATARAGNVIGGGDWSTDRLVPDILKAWLNQEPVMIRSPHAVRPWQLVLEPLHGYLCLAEHLYKDPKRYSEGWNFGPDEAAAQPVAWIVDRLSTLWGDGAVWEQDPSAQLHEANFLKLDSSKARFRLGWTPTLSLEIALSWVVEWTQAFQAGKPMRSVTEHQIKQFMEKITQ